MKKITINLLIFSFIFFIICSCKNEKKIDDVLPGYWEADSIQVNVGNNSVMVRNMQEFNSDIKYIGFNFYKNGTVEGSIGSSSRTFNHWKLDNKNDIIVEVDNSENFTCELINETTLKIIFNPDKEYKIREVTAYLSKKSNNVNKEILSKSIDNQDVENDKTSKLLSKVSGTAFFASDGIPYDVNVYAKELKTDKVIKHMFFDRELGHFEFELESGEYIIFSTNDISTVNPDMIKKIVVKAGKNINNIEAQDLSSYGISEIETVEE